MSLSSRVSTHSNVEFPPGRLLVAFSGGEDSLYLLSIVPKERAFPVYVNHNLRTKDELDREIDLNRKNAEALGFSLTVVDIRTQNRQSHSFTLVHEEADLLDVRQVAAQ